MLRPLLFVCSAAICSIHARECRKSVEIVQVQDASASFETFLDDMSHMGVLLVKRLADEFDSVQMGIASFVDKPTPFRGIGYGRGYISECDYCYRNHVPLTLKGDALNDAFASAKKLNGAGGDYIENPYEALIYAAQDPQMGLTPPDVVFNDKDEFVLRVVIIVTDDAPHYAGDAQLGITQWNPTGNPYEKHFWHPDFIQLGGIAEKEKNKGKYTRLLELRKKTDLTPDESSEFTRLLHLLGPDTYEPALTNDGAFANHEECWRYEYPTLETVSKIIKKQRILPVVVVAPGKYISNDTSALCIQRGFDVPPGPTTDDNRDIFMKCLASIYKTDFETMNVEQAVVAQFDGDASAALEVIVASVSYIANSAVCPDITWPQEEEGFVSDHESKEGLKTGIIASAVGGAAVGLLAVGLLAYKKLGAGLFGNGGASDFGAGAQVDMPSNPLEREAMEEVTLDMFQ